jgi:hypothetical protein
VGEMSTEMQSVTLLDFPVELVQRAREHGEALLREFAMIVHGASDRDTNVPKRLLELAAESDKRYSGLNPHAEDVLDAARERGDDYVDLDLEVPVTFKQETLDAVPVLLEVEQYCRNGELLTLVPDDDLRLFWQWYLAEFVRQIDGEPAISWRDFVASVT